MTDTESLLWEEPRPEGYETLDEFHAATEAYRKGYESGLDTRETAFDEDLSDLPEEVTVRIEAGEEVEGESLPDPDLDSVIRVISKALGIVLDSPDAPRVRVLNLGDFLYEAEEEPEGPDEEANPGTGYFNPVASANAAFREVLGNDLYEISEDLLEVARQVTVIVENLRSLVEQVA